MKKNFSVLVILVLFITNSSFSQTLTYDYSDYNYHKMKAVLLIEGKQSVFFTLDSRKTGLQNTSDGKVYGILNDSWSRIFFNSSQKNIVRIPFKRGELVYSNYPSQVKFSKIIKRIGEYNCQKAIVTKGKRTYEVWFDPKVPIQFAPWGITEIPGLVVEINGNFDYDISLKLNSIQKSVNKSDFEKYSNFILSKRVMNLEEYEKEVTKLVINEKRIKMADLAKISKEYGASNIKFEGDVDYVFLKHLIDIPNGLDQKLKKIN